MNDEELQGRAAEPANEPGEPVRFWAETEGGAAVPFEGSFLEWARWYESADRSVALDAIGELRVSTIFASVAFAAECHHPPLLYETMVFRAGRAEAQWLYCTRESAQIGHRAITTALRDGVSLEAVREMELEP